jgi:hypothetical protein
MANATQCAECQSIVDEFRGALAELSPERMDQFWSYRDAFAEMIGGTEEDAERVEEIAEEYRFRPRLPGSPETRDRDRYYAKIHTALRQMLVHGFRTGHSRLFKQLFSK